MFKRGMIAGLALVLFSFTFAWPRIGSAELEATVQNQLKLEKTPLDVASSVDGRWMFILTPGELLVYSDDGKLEKRIPVDKTFDHISYAVPNKTLILTSSADKTVKIIELDVIQHFSLEGLPFEGAKNARVTLVVFSDYQ